MEHRIRLESHGVLVKNVFLPPFVVQPEVVIWGMRHFQKVSATVYTEVFAYFLTAFNEIDDDGN